MSDSRFTVSTCGVCGCYVRADLTRCPTTMADKPVCPDCFFKKCREIAAAGLTAPTLSDDAFLEGWCRPDSSGRDS